MHKVVSRNREREKANADAGLNSNRTTHPRAGSSVCVVEGEKAGYEPISVVRKCYVVFESYGATG